MGGYFEKKKKKKISQTKHKHLLGTITSSVKSVQYRVTKTLPLYSLNPDPPLCDHGRSSLKRLCHSFLHLSKPLSLSLGKRQCQTTKLPTE